MAQNGLSAKICGLSDGDAVAAAVTGGARFVGFVFYPPSPRSVSPEKAHELAREVPAEIFRVGVYDGELCCPTSIPIQHHYR